MLNEWSGPSAAVKFTTYPRQSQPLKNADLGSDWTRYETRPAPSSAEGPAGTAWKWCVLVCRRTRAADGHVHGPWVPGWPPLLCGTLTHARTHTHVSLFGLQGILFQRAA